MTFLKTLAIVAGLALALPASVLRAEDMPANPPTEQPKPKDKEKKPASPKMTKPWSLLKSLSDEQKAKIAEIHAKYLAERKKLDEAEKADVMGVLTDEQKKELEEALTAEEAARKAKDEQKKKDKDEQAPQDKPKND